jgi:Ca-activated chloride channel family protein
MIVVDISESMLAEDIPPSRIERARAVAADLVERLPGHRLGIVAVAGTAYVQCPLTLDQSAVRLFLDILEVGDVPDPGSDLAAGIETAMEAFPEASTGTRVIVLLTDGEDHEGRGVEAARQAGEAGVMVYPLGIGTREGGPIPAPEADTPTGGYKKDRAGRVITTRLDTEHLEAMARAGRGEALAAGVPPDASRRLAERIDQMASAELGSRILTTRIERFQVPLALALLCLLIEGVVPRARRASRTP